jgi:hypothetical protein
MTAKFIFLSEKTFLLRSDGLFRVDSGYQVIYWGGTNRRFELRLGDGTQTIWVSSLWLTADELKAGEWYHLACTWDGPTDTGKIYLNGKTIGTYTTSAPFSIVNHSGFKVRIGNRWGGIYSSFHGVIDGVRISDVAYKFSPPELPLMVMDKVGSSGITVNGDLSDWNGANWIALDQDYYQGANANDITEASYAVKWSDNGNKIYVAVKVKDASQVFTDVYDYWNVRDAVEIYLHTTGTGDGTYSSTQAKAQQYSIGITSSDHMAIWSVVGEDQLIPANAGFQAAGRVNGEWIYYEAALTPYEFFSLDGNGLVVSPLHLDDIIRFDVVVAGQNGNTGNFGMKSANTRIDKSANYFNFQRFQLAAAPVLKPGDANGDGMVDVGDLGILAANYGGTGKTWAQGDFNNDGAVDVGDLGILAAHYGEGSIQPTSFSDDYAAAFGTTVTDDTEDDATTSSSICSGLGLPLIAGLALMGLMLVKLEE